MGPPASAMFFHGVSRQTFSCAAAYWWGQGSGSYWRTDDVNKGGTSATMQKCNEPDLLRWREHTPVLHFDHMNVVFAQGDARRTCCSRYFGVVDDTQSPSITRQH